MARAPLFHGETLIGEVIEGEQVFYSPEEPILIIRLERQAGLVKELMREELVSFNVYPLSAQQG
jgi:hypothetical protein